MRRLNPVQQRREFEAWAQKAGYPAFAWQGGSYSDPCVQKVWRAWCFAHR